MKQILLLAVALVYTLALLASAAPLTGSWESRLLLLPAGPSPAKASETALCLEAALELSNAVSGLQLGSRMTFSFVGPEYGLFTVQGALGALDLRDTIVFSRNIVEADSSGLIQQISPDPGGLVGAYLPIPFYDLVTPHAELCRLLGPTLEGQPVLFRKKIAELSFQISGLRLTGTFLFANLGSAGTPAFQIGAALGVNGQTVSGIEFEAMTLIGMRNEDGFEFECFGECRPRDRFYQGRVVPGFALELERLSVKKLALAGITLDVVTLFNFDAAEGPVGLHKTTVTASAKVAPLSLSVTDILILDGSLHWSSHTLITSFQKGDVFVTAIFTDLADPSNDAGFEFQTLIASFNVDNGSITSTLNLCADDDADCAFLDAIYLHDLQLFYTDGPLKITGLLEFYGFITNFNKLVFSVDLALGAVTLHSGTAVQSDELIVQEFGITVKF